MGAVALVQNTLVKQAPKIIQSAAKFIPKISPPALPILGGIGGAIGVVVGELLSPKPTAKTDLASVEKFLGYKAEAGKTVVPEIPQEWYGGQEPTKRYRAAYSRASTYRGTFYGWQDGFSITVTNGLIAPVSNPELWIGETKLGTLKHWSSFNQGIEPRSNDETRPYVIKCTMGNGQYVAMSLSPVNGVWIRGFLPLGSTEPDGADPPPIQEAIVGNNSVAVAIPPQPVSANNPSLPSAIPQTSPTKERKAGYPVQNPVAPPSSLPRSLSRPQSSPDIEVNPALQPTVPLAPAPRTLPGQSGFFPTTSPIPVSKPTSLSNPTTTIRRKVPTITNSSAINASNPSSPTLQRTVAPPISLPIPIPAPEANITGANINWEAVLTPALVGSYATSQFRNEIKTQTREAICQSTETGGCMKNNIFSPLKDKVDDIFDGLGLIGQGTDLAITNDILGKVTDIQSKVNDSSFGLQAIGNFMRNAWENTKLDKVLNVLNTVLALHNALMLSRNLAQTLGDVVSQALQFIGIKDAEGQAIDVNSFIGNTVDTWITNLVGAQTYANIQQTWVSLNRIMVAAQGVVFAVQGIKNAVLESIETVGQWTARIGNNMIIQGLLEERSFPWMDENINFRNPFSRFVQRIETTEEIVSQVNNLVSSGIEAQQNFNEIFEQSSSVVTASQELQNNLSQFDTDKETTETQEKINSESPNIDRLDLIQLEPDEI